MKYRCEIEVPDYDMTAKLDMMAKASRDESMWVQIFPRPNRMEYTDLDNKCGSCEHFRTQNPTDSNGYCKCGHAWGPRSRPRCKDYERTEGWQRKDTFG